MMTIFARMVLITGAKYIFLNTQSYITGFIVRAPASVEVLRCLNVKIQWCCCVHKFICIAGGGRKKGFQGGEMVWDGLSGRVPDKDGSHHNAWQDARMAILGSHQGVVHLSYRAERWRPRALCCALCFGRPPLWPHRYHAHITEAEVSSLKEPSISSRIVMESN